MGFRLTPPVGRVACAHVLLPLRQRDHRQIQVLSLLRSRSHGDDAGPCHRHGRAPGDRSRARGAGGRVRDHRGAGAGRDGPGLPGPGPPARARGRHQGAAVLARLRRRVRRAIPARGPHRGPARASQHHPDLPGRPVGPGHLLRHEVPAGRLALDRPAASGRSSPRPRSAGSCSRPAARSATRPSAASSIATSSPTTSCSTSSASAC